MHFGQFECCHRDAEVPSFGGSGAASVRLKTHSGSATMVIGGLDRLPEHRAIARYRSAWLMSGLVIFQPATGAPREAFSGRLGVEVIEMFRPGGPPVNEHILAAPENIPSRSKYHCYAKQNQKESIIFWPTCRARPCPNSNSMHSVCFSDSNDSF